MDFDFKNAQSQGLHTPDAVGFMPYHVENGNIVPDYAKAVSGLANDAALSTMPNIGAPAALYTYIDPRIIPVLFGALNSAKFFAPTKLAEWTMDNATFSVEELSGNVSPYADFSNAGNADVNYNFPSREQFRYQTAIKYGDLEQEKYGVAKINLVGRKQFAAAQTIARAENRFNLYGVAGIECYGMLNDPNLPASITPISVGGKSTWADKVAANPDQAANIVFNDVNKLITELFANNGGNLSVTEKMILGCSNKVLSYLTIPNAFGKTAKQLLEENYSGLVIEQLPELSTEAGEMLYLVVPELLGDQTGFSAFSEKFRLSRLVANTTSFEQKAMAGTFGTIIRRPSLVATMIGV